MAASKSDSFLPTQTPLYYALNKSRYARQEQIRKIEELTGRSLIVYFADISHPDSLISSEDIAPFGDLLSRLEGDKLDLMIQSPGGDIDKAEKIVYMCREKSKEFRVIVPECAKSAATLIALAADSIVMGYISELGPIDPQIVITTSTGKTLVRPARSFLDGLEYIKEQIAESGEIPYVYFPLLEQLDPALLDYCDKAIKRSEAFAVKWLERGMCKGDTEKAKEIAGLLLDVNKYLSHGTVIDAQEAKEELGLEVEYLPPEDQLWKMIWQLYCLYAADIKQFSLVKIYESNSVSLYVEAE